MECLGSRIWISIISMGCWEVVSDFRWSDTHKVENDQEQDPNIAYHVSFKIYQSGYVWLISKENIYHWPQTTTIW